MTLFAPNDAAVRAFRGKRTETLVLNHLANVALSADELPERVSSLVTGNPPLWVSRGRGGVFVNQARIVGPDVRARSRRGDEQVMHIVDSVLEPLAPISARDSEYFTRLDAFKLLTKSTLYDLGGDRARVFNGQAEVNGRTHMFAVKGESFVYILFYNSFAIFTILFRHPYVFHSG